MTQTSNVIESIFIAVAKTIRTFFCTLFRGSCLNEALYNLLQLSQSLLLQGKSTEPVLEVMIPS